MSDMGCANSTNSAPADAPPASSSSGAATAAATNGHQHDHKEVKHDDAASAALWSANRPLVIFVLGGPGAGKGTQCANIVRDYHFVHLSAGDLLREEKTKGGDTADLINNYIKEGKIVPVEVTVNLIKKAMEEAGKQGKKLFLVDGFPRSQDNLEGWFDIMNDFTEVGFVLFFDCPESVMEARLLERGKTSGRTDDNIESIKKRFKTFVEQSMPIVNWFDAQGKVRKVDATPTPEDVYTVVKKFFDAEIERRKLLQTTFAFIKPDVVAAGRADELLQKIREGGFEILAKKQLQLTQDQAEEFYGEHKGKPFFEGLVGFMTGGPAVALALRKENAIKAWREFIGPTKTEVAKEQAPNSVRALFGTDGTKNAAHGSDSIDSAKRELGILFPGLVFY